MLKRIEPITDIIVAVKKDKGYKWYISYREIWLLDYAKYCHAFDPNDDNYEDRFDIGVLDETSFESFRIKAAKYEFNVDVLRKEFQTFLPLKDWDSSFHLFPALFINFDDKVLYSVYQESISFENYVPSGWTGFYEDFYEMIPNDEKYWLINGVDYFQLLVNKI